MPKVSQDYKDARREQILSAAKRCFARNGFHETSMHDLFAEAGLSSGAVYRYFPGKADVVRAIAEANLDEMMSLVHGLAADRTRGLGMALATLMDVLRDKNNREGLGATAVLVWSEALRNPALANRLRQALDQMSGDLMVLVRDQQGACTLPDGLGDEALARLLTALISGSILQLALLGDEAMRDVPEAVKALWPS
jgi:TetR/AcrR family transcriptional regulator, transcriptional repressor of aconitase